jgi:hypothetical protein
LFALQVRDLGAVFQIVGGTGGSVLILLLPGLLLMQYAYSKHAASVADAAEAALRHQQTLPTSRSIFPVYNYWTSRLFWGGVALVASSVALIGTTVYTVFLVK